MNAYLTHLGIRPEVQEWLGPYYYINTAGHLCFDYGDDTETYGLGFHRLPAKGCWTAGAPNPLIRQTILCSSALESIAWLHHHPVNFDHIQLIATNIFNHLPKNSYTLVFANDLLGHIYDLKAAAALTNFPLTLSVDEYTVDITFRFKKYRLPCATFSLNAFERISGYRFTRIKTSKPSRQSSWLNQLLNYGND